MHLQAFQSWNWTRRTLIFYFVFQAIHAVLFAYGWWKQYEDPRLVALNKLTYSVWISRGAGLVLSLDTSLLLLPMCRQTLKWIRPKVPWLHLDEFQWFHRQVAYSLLFYTCLHVASHYVNFLNVEKLKLRPVTSVQIHYTEAGPITGHVMLFCMILMFTSAHAKIRRQSYESFWYIHHLFIIFYLSLLCHGTGCFVRDTAKPYSPFAGSNFWKHCLGYQSWRWEIVGATLYLFERLYRICNSRRPARIIGILSHPSNVLEIQFHKDSMDYKSGQWLLVKLPDTSAKQWHPFTISSSPFDPFVSVHILQVGDFTGAFGDTFRSNEGRYSLKRINSAGLSELALQPGQAMPRIRIDGPYGAPAEDIFNNEVAVMIGGGIGVTPWASILKSIWHIRNDPSLSKECRLRRLEFIWVCKDILHCQWFQKLIDMLNHQSAALQDCHRWPVLRCRIFITRKLEASRLSFSGAPIAGEPRIPAFELQERMLYGRPNFVEELTAIRDDLINEGDVHIATRSSKMKVGVYYCGPETARRAAQKACMVVSDERVKFKFWMEHG